jgi:hypothetical protein
MMGYKNEAGVQAAKAFPSARDGEVFDRFCSCNSRCLCWQLAASACHRPSTQLLLLLL